MSNKEQLLENEIKYFKQQIEILVQDHNGLIKHLDEKEQEITNLNKLIENLEKDREQHTVLLNQTHNDKQALSRAIQQNKDLKQQLVELQDAYVTVTQQNLELTTRLQAEEFKLSQMVKVDQQQLEKTVQNETEKENCENNVESSESKAETKSNYSSSEWDDDNSDDSKNKENDLENNSSLMDGIKVTIWSA